MLSATLRSTRALRMSRSARVLHTEVAAQRCPFAVLGVPRGASVADIKSKYRQEAMKHHPDRSSSDGQRFMELAVAYSTLTGAGQHSRDSKEVMNARDAERILDSIRDCREVVELLILELLDNARSQNKETTKTAAVLERILRESRKGTSTPTTY